MISVDESKAENSHKNRRGRGAFSPLMLLSQGLHQEWDAQHGRFFFWTPVFFAFGIAVYFLLPLEPPLILGGGALALAFSMYSLLSQDNCFYRRMALAMLVLPALGFGFSQLHSLRVHTPMLNNELGPVMVSGIVQSLEIMKPDYDARVVLGRVDVEDLSAEKTPRYIRLRVRKDYELKVGERISALAQLMPLSGPVAPGGFDFRRHLFFDGIGAVGFIYSGVEKIQSHDGFSMARGIETLRAAVGASVFDHLSGRQANIATALMNGQRAGIPDEEQDILRSAGLAHLLAISGLHLGLVCGAIFFFSRLVLASLPKVALHYPIKKYCAVLAMFGGLVYMFLAGATVPTQRAMLMSAVVFTAILFDRSPFSLRLVVFAALIVLALSPYSLLGASFQLSFAAVTALVAFYDRLRPLISKFHRHAAWPRKIAFYFFSVCMTSLIASLATAPFALYHFQQFAAYGILANMVAIPIMAFWVMPLIVISLLAMPMGLEAVPLHLIGFGIDQILQAADFVAGLDGAVYRLPAFSFWYFVLVVCGLLFFILWQGRLRAAGLLLAGLMVPFILSQPRPDAMVSAEHSLVALRAGDSIRVNTVRKDSFVRENWEQLWGLEKDSARLWAKHWPEECDDLGCRAVLSNIKIAYSLSPYTHKEDCAWADILIADHPVRISCGARVIDKFDTYYNGAQRIYLNDGALKVENVREVTSANRPWSPLYPVR